jgi:hypothetical protein
MKQREGRRTAIIGLSRPTPALALEAFSGDAPLL